MYKFPLTWYMCKKCKATFSTREKLISHKRQVHKVEKLGQTNYELELTNSNQLEVSVNRDDEESRANSSTSTSYINNNKIKTSARQESSSRNSIKDKNIDVSIETRVASPESPEEDYLAFDNNLSDDNEDGDRTREENARDKDNDVYTNIHSQSFKNASPKKIQCNKELVVQLERLSCDASEIDVKVFAAPLRDEESQLPNIPETSTDSYSDPVESPDTESNGNQEQDNALLISAAAILDDILQSSSIDLSAIQLYTSIDTLGPLPGEEVVNGNIPSQLNNEEGQGTGSVPFTPLEEFGGNIITNIENGDFSVRSSAIDIFSNDTEENIAENVEHDQLEENSSRKIIFDAENIPNEISTQYLQTNIDLDHPLDKEKNSPDFARNSEIENPWQKFPTEDVEKEIVGNVAVEDQALNEEVEKNSPDLMQSSEVGNTSQEFPTNVPEKDIAGDVEQLLEEEIEMNSPELFKSSKIENPSEESPKTALQENIVKIVEQPLDLDEEASTHSPELIESPDVENPLQEFPIRVLEENIVENGEQQEVEQSLPENNEWPVEINSLEQSKDIPENVEQALDDKEHYLSQETAVSNELSADTPGNVEQPSNEEVFDSSHLIRISEIENPSQEFPIQFLAEDFGENVEEISEKNSSDGSTSTEVCKSFHTHEDANENIEHPPKKKIQVDERSLIEKGQSGPSVFINYLSLNSLEQSNHITKSLDHLSEENCSSPQINLQDIEKSSNETSNSQSDLEGVVSENVQKSKEGPEKDITASVRSLRSQSILVTKIKQEIPDKSYQGKRCDNKIARTHVFAKIKVEPPENIEKISEKTVAKTPPKAIIENILLLTEKGTKTPSPRSRSPKTKNLRKILRSSPRHLIITNKRKRARKRHSCNDCSRTFSQYLHWVDHIKVHIKKDKHICNICGKKFDKKETLAKHSKLHDKKQPEKEVKKEKHVKIQKVKEEATEECYTCDFCGKEFPKGGGLKSHITRIHSGDTEYSCNYCGRTFPQSVSLKKHLTAHSGTSGEKCYACHLCGKPFLQSVSLKKHVGAHEDATYKCYRCGRVLVDSIKLKRHIKLLHETTGEIKDKPIKVENSPVKKKPKIKIEKTDAEKVRKAKSEAVAENTTQKATLANSEPKKKVKVKGTGENKKQHVASVETLEIATQRLKTKVENAEVKKKRKVEFESSGENKKRKSILKNSGENKKQKVTAVNTGGEKKRKINTKIAGQKTKPKTPLVNAELKRKLKSPLVNAGKKSKLKVRLLNAKHNTKLKNPVVKTGQKRNSNIPLGNAGLAGQKTKLKTPLKNAGLTGQNTIKLKTPLGNAGVTGQKITKLKTLLKNVGVTGQKITKLKTLLKNTGVTGQKTKLKPPLKNAGLTGQKTKLKTSLKNVGLTGQKITKLKSPLKTVGLAGQKTKLKTPLKNAGVTEQKTKLKTPLKNAGLTRQKTKLKSPLKNVGLAGKKTKLKTGEKSTPKTPVKKIGEKTKPTISVVKKGQKSNPKSPLKDSAPKKKPRIPLDNSVLKTKRQMPLEKAILLPSPKSKKKLQITLEKAIQLSSSIAKMKRQLKLENAVQLSSSKKNGDKKTTLQVKVKLPVSASTGAKNKRNLKLEKKLHYCSFCNKGFSQLHNMKRHMTTTMGKCSKKPFCCNYCAKRFASRETMQKHAETHIVI